MEMGKQCQEISSHDIHNNNIGHATQVNCRQTHDTQTTIVFKRLDVVAGLTVVSGADGECISLFNK